MIKEFFEKNDETLDLYTKAITRAHGKNHPEVFEVRNLYQKIQEATTIWPASLPGCAQSRATTRSQATCVARSGRPTGFFRSSTGWPRKSPSARRRGGLPWRSAPAYRSFRCLATSR